MALESRGGRRKILGHSIVTARRRSVTALTSQMQPMPHKIYNININIVYNKLYLIYVYIVYPHTHDRDSELKHVCAGMIPGKGRVKSRRVY